MKCSHERGDIVTYLATAIVFFIFGFVVGFIVCGKLVKVVLDEKFEKLTKFMKNRPHNRDKHIIDATIEYIEQVENKSVERYESLNK